MSEEEREKFDEQVGQAENPADQALEDLRRHQEEMGMVFEHPDEPVPGS